MRCPCRDDLHNSRRARCGFCGIGRKAQNPRLGRGPAWFCNATERPQNHAPNGIRTKTDPLPTKPFACASGIRFLVLARKSPRFGLDRAQRELSWKPQLDAPERLRWGALARLSAAAPGVPAHTWTARRRQASGLTAACKASAAAPGVPAHAWTARRRQASGLTAACKATTLRAPERKEKQRRWHAPARLNRVRSVVTIEVTLLVRRKAGVHKAYPAQESGQLRIPGLCRASPASACLGCAASGQHAQGVDLAVVIDLAHSCALAADAQVFLDRQRSEQVLAIDQLAGA